MIPTSEQLLTSMTGDGVRFSLNGVEYIIIRSEDFDNVKGPMEADHQELRTRLAHSSAANGWDEPGMEAYDSYPENP